MATTKRRHPRGMLVVVETNPLNRRKAFFITLFKPGRLSIFMGLVQTAPDSSFNWKTKRGSLIIHNKNAVFSNFLFSLGARGETGESYFTGFIVAVIIGTLLLLVVVVLAYLTYTNRRRGAWNHNGMNGNGNKNMEPFLLDSEDADSNGDANSLGGYSCPKGQYRDTITMSNL